MQSPLTSVHAGPDPDYKPEKVFGKVIKPNAYAPCQKVYDEYYSCIFVEEASYGKFIGKCNHFKRALDECNIINRELARKANLEKAREKKQLMQEIDAKLQREEAAAASKAAEPPKKAWYKVW